MEVPFQKRSRLINWPIYLVVSRAAHELDNSEPRQAKIERGRSVSPARLLLVALVILHLRS
jgi:hypothetical protein